MLGYHSFKMPLITQCGGFAAINSSLASSANTDRKSFEIVLTFQLSLDARATRNPPNTVEKKVLRFIYILIGKGGSPPLPL